jgi:hypothetical protein
MRMYILIGVYRRKKVLGETVSDDITAIATIVCLKTTISLYHGNVKKKRLY